ncbi:MAG: RNA methyltransferase [Flavobacteriales bacterium]|nr:RNA methyltransferase [Flavobacteriales bacterium]
MPPGDRKLTLDELSAGHHATRARVGPSRLRLVLDDVRSRHNVGAMFRTADAFGMEELMLCGFTPTPPHREIEKTALGATQTVPWSHRSEAINAVRELQASGYRVIALEQTLHAGALAATPVLSGQPLALVVGNELHGVSEAVVEACDACVVIPQQGAKHSLNVSVCAGIALWWLSGGALPPPP